MAIESANLSTMVTGLFPTIRTTVWLLNKMNLACGFPRLWVLSPVCHQHRVLFALYCSLVTTTIYALAEHIAVLCLGSSPRSPWIWIVSLSPMHLWCANLCLMFRQEVCQSQPEHLGKSGEEKHQEHVTDDPSWLMAVCFIPAAILNATTSAAMLLLERKFDQPRTHGQTPFMQIFLGCFTMVMFIVCRYADYMILRSSHSLRGYDIRIGSLGILSLFVVRSLCDALTSASAFNPPA